MASHLPLKGQRAFVTGASMGIGEATARKLAGLGAVVFLFARSEDKLRSISTSISTDIPGSSVCTYAGDLRDSSVCREAVQNALKAMGGIDILINNAGLALGAPAPFWEMDLALIDQMNDTNVKGLMYITHAVLSKAFMPNGRKGSIINVSSITGLNAPPFPGEAVYHTNKAAVEAFSNVLRTELNETDVKVLVVRPGQVANHFHEQRVGYDKGSLDNFFEGTRPLISEDIAETIAAMLQTPARVSWTAVDCVPTSTRSMYVLDRQYNKRHPDGVKGDNTWRD